MSKLRTSRLCSIQPCLLGHDMPLFISLGNTTASASTQSASMPSNHVISRHQHRSCGISIVMYALLTRDLQPTPVLHELLCASQIPLTCCHTAGLHANCPANTLYNWAALDNSVMAFGSFKLFGCFIDVQVTRTRASACTSSTGKRAWLERERGDEYMSERSASKQLDT